MSTRGTTRGCSRTARAEAGSALIWALFFVALTSGVLIAHSIEMTANRRTMDTRYRYVDVARNVALSGLTEATAYLRRQPNQPVLEFAPQSDPNADPPLDETEDPELGLVREYEIQGSLWARYEVRKDEALDVSANYGESPGTVWDVAARAYLFQRNDRRRAFDAPPNRVLARQPIRTEMRGLPVDVPGSSAIVVLDPAQISMLGSGVIDGASEPALSYRKPAGPVVLPTLDVSITGTPTAVAVANLSISVKDVFRVGNEQLRNLSDIVVTSPRQLENHDFEDQAVYVPGDLTLATSGAGLHGRMLLFVQGDFVAYGGNDSDFSGLLYVQGNSLIKGPFKFRGTIIAGGQLQVGGSADAVAINYDAGEVQRLRDALGRYRMCHDLRPATGTGAFATAQELSALSGCR